MHASTSKSLKIYTANDRYARASLSASHIYAAWSYTWPTLALCEPHIHTAWSYTWPTLALHELHTHCMVLHLANPHFLQATHTLSGLTPGQPSLSASNTHIVWSYTWPTLALCKLHTHCMILHLANPLANPRSLQATYTLSGLTPGQPSLSASYIHTAWSYTWPITFVNYLRLCPETPPYFVVYGIMFHCLGPKPCYPVVTLHEQFTNATKSTTLSKIQYYYYYFCLYFNTVLFHQQVLLL